MKTLILKNGKALLTWVMLMLCVNVWSILNVNAALSNEDNKVETGGKWEDDDKRNFTLCSISIYKYSQYLTIQDSNPVNTITVRITRNDSGATVFENVYPQGQTSFIVIPLQGWSAGSYTIELFGRENNGYLWGTFQVLL